MQFRWDNAALIHKRILHYLRDVFNVYMTRISCRILIFTTASMVDVCRPLFGITGVLCDVNQSSYIAASFKSRWALLSCDRLRDAFIWVSVEHLFHSVYRHTAKNFIAVWATAMSAGHMLSVQYARSMRTARCNTTARETTSPGASPYWGSSKSSAGSVIQKLNVLCDTARL